MRIQPNADFAEAIAVMSSGNPGALMALIEMAKHGHLVDPNQIAGGFYYIMKLDQFEIYGSDIYVLFSDICERKLHWLLATIKAPELGLINEEILKEAASKQDYSGRKLINAEHIYNEVKLKVQNFNEYNEGRS
ncbi:hypothetical protein EFA69_16075 [Rufibacter immobilis]|uniref:Uncharacterized protein n=1 Tax=Rufibacter immobilis TaxID=1348778 RepID=A0A3M9MQ27_9BACT|nr:hypothetical protein [Rufibacter immobilis]RNI27634.1 hypothetical protein EFA69_16075 [Rufibacter immobilis]